MSQLFKLSFEQLMLSNVFLGSRKETFIGIMKSFVLGYRGPFCILNLSYTFIQFKLLVHILLNIFFLRKKILVVKENDIYNFKADLDVEALYFYNQKWIGGCLTNFRIVSQHPRFFELSKSFIELRALKYLPSFIFLFDSNISESALFEGCGLGIPISAIASSDCLFFESINYPIIGNTECYESMYLYLHVLRDVVNFSSIEESLKILNLYFVKASDWLGKKVLFKHKKKKKYIIFDTKIVW